MSNEHPFAPPKVKVVAVVDINITVTSEDPAKTIKKGGVANNPISPQDMDRVTMTIAQEIQSQIKENEVLDTIITVLHPKSKEQQQ